MAEKRVSVRLAAVGGRQVRAELEGVGQAGSRGFGRLSREMEAANSRLAAFSRRVRAAAAAAVAAAAAAGVAMIRSGLQTVSAQAKLAQSLGTTVASIQTLERAGELAGVSMSGRGSNPSCAMVSSLIIILNCVVGPAFRRICPAYRPVGAKIQP